jgi:serine O-acetyltransferase
MCAAFNLWETLREEAERLHQSDPLAQRLLQAQVLSRESFAESLAITLANQLAGEIVDDFCLENLFLDAYRENPELLTTASADIIATKERDPATRHYLDPLLFYKGFQALQTQRVAHLFWKQNNIFTAKMLQSAVSRKLSVDIHPAAPIGHGILLDHAIGLVIGETARIGNNVSILHGVTLGGTGKETGDRHPKICDGVMIGAHAQLLGNIHIGEGAKIGAGAVVLTNVPPHTTYAGVPAVEIGSPCEDMPAQHMKQDFTCDAAR